MHHLPFRDVLLAQTLANKEIQPNTKQVKTTQHNTQHDTKYIQKSNFAKSEDFKITLAEKL